MGRGAERNGEANSSEKMGKPWVGCDVIPVPGHGKVDQRRLASGKSCVKKMERRFAVVGVSVESRDSQLWHVGCFSSPREAAGRLVHGSAIGMFIRLDCVKRNESSIAADGEKGAGFLECRAPVHQLEIRAPKSLMCCAICGFSASHLLKFLDG